jgi:hypothetical protein
MRALCSSCLFHTKTKDCRACTILLFFFPLLSFSFPFTFQLASFLGFVRVRFAANVREITAADGRCIPPARYYAQADSNAAVRPAVARRDAPRRRPRGLGPAEGVAGHRCCRHETHGRGNGRGWYSGGGGGRIWWEPRGWGEDAGRRGAGCRTQQSACSP